MAEFWKQNGCVCTSWDNSYEAVEVRSNTYPKGKIISAISGDNTYYNTEDFIWEEVEFSKTHSDDKPKWVAVEFSESYND